MDHQHQDEKAAKRSSLSSKGSDEEGAGHTTPSPLVRQLKNRHISMITMGGVIGMGLFLGTAGSLSNGGPVGLLLGFTAVGTICYCVMISLGEMVAFLPIAGGHIKMADRFVNQAFSFTMGWNFWYCWLMLLPTELSAASVLVDFWTESTKLNAVWITIIMVVVVAINLCGAGVYGEAEFIFASIKVITITGLIILGIVLDLGGGPNHDRIGFRYWKDPGPFVQFSHIGGAKGRFLGWWSVTTQAAFSYIGTEIVALAAGEAKNPKRNIPKAITRVYIRILLFYIAGTAVIGLLVPSNDPSLNLKVSTAAKSPFVIAIKHAGIGGLPSVINACLLTAAASAASSDLYTSSRALYGLAASGNAPKLFLRTSRRGVPYASIIFCSLFSTLAYMGINAGAGTVFGWFVNMTSVTGLMTWFGISFTYLRFRKGFRAQGLDRKTLPFTSPLQPFAAWYALVSCLVICFFSGFSVFLDGQWDTATFITNYLPLAAFPFMYVVARLLTKTPIRKPLQMDFVSDLVEIEADSYEDPPPKNMLEAFWAWLVSVKACGAPSVTAA
ncbi:hypothetical protein PLICRDRAFT_179755 [Plicaturopsis crispa FD-325 SS-3]|uniref:Amino acid permease/ SLC12A domain-containing protein n=1 Tax=Plicaturopsis crispa FD-325 SS-3 TaxID=944288 RepID=A0A0C9T7B7_PLICR|nr:hypothetical protein PLICRDRAFT_179755 [Plicaturopsis crispa FD-325 SS-3]